MPICLRHQPAVRHTVTHVLGASRDEAVFYVAFYDEARSVDLPGILEVSRSRPLIAMADRLRAIERAMLHFDQLVTAAPGEALSTDNSDSLAALLYRLREPWTRLLWGPPGAGKTRCVATLSTALLQAAPDERVLLVAPSNVAVDAALLELMEALRRGPTTQDFLHRHLVARFGYSRDERILEHPELFGPPELANLSEQILSVHRELQRRVERRERDEVIAELKAVIGQLQQERRRKMAAFLCAARVVATTVTSAFAVESPVFEAGPWQTLIVDEASMISGATALLLASAAAKRFLVVGDPRQLGPIFDWRRREQPPETVVRWCGSDPYELAGISRGIGWWRTVETDDIRLSADFVPAPLSPSDLVPRGEAVPESRFGG